jgi:uncharacterized DUF497 family protein
VEFDWDDGNIGKSLYRHGVHDHEIEEALLDSHGVRIAARAVDGERRHGWLGRAVSSGRYLRIIYTEREHAGRRFVRPISAVLMNRTERARYSR